MCWLLWMTTFLTVSEKWRFDVRSSELDLTKSRFSCSDSKRGVNILEGASGTAISGDVPAR